MLDWFRTLLPQDERFFDLFAEHSRIVVAGATALRDMLDGSGAAMRQCKLVMEREREAAVLAHGQPNRFGRGRCGAANDHLRARPLPSQRPPERVAEVCE